MSEAQQGSEAGQNVSEGGDSGATQGSEGGGGEGLRTFSQADLNKIAANEKRDGSKAGRQAAISELLETTGASSWDDVIAGYQEYQGIQEAVSTEADRANQRAERLEKRAKSAEERYTTTLREFALRDALRDSGINSARLPLALKVADMESLKVASDGSGAVDGIEGAVEALKEASPEWFEPEGRARINAPQTSGTGAKLPTGLEAQLQAALDKGDYRSADKLRKLQLQEQGRFQIGVRLPGR